jgi:glycosyltransferase involved in cell wall biosynthesis
MRIGLIAPPWLAVPPHQYGGIEMVVDGLARGLSAAGHDVVLAARHDSTCPVPRVPLPDCTAGTYQMGAIVPELRHAAESYRRLTAIGVDIIHDHTLLGPLTVGGSQATPVVTTNHGPFDQDLREIYSLLDERVGVIAISRHQASAASPVHVARVIHHGIDVDEYPEGIGNGGYALFLGRMNPDKGVAEAIDIARRAGVPLKIAAKMREPAERRYFRTYIAPRLGQGVDYLGEVGPADKRRLLAGAVALINPIRWPEPFGLVMIEAMACGTPVVASRRGAAEEIVVEGATGFTAPDDDGLVEALANVGTIDRARCRRHVARNFSTQRMVDEHVSFYCSRLGESRSALAALIA